MKSPNLPSRATLRTAALASVFVGALLAAGLSAAQTDLADAPLFTSSADVVKPNIMFIMDNSGSMALDYMPSGARDIATVGKRSSQCNGVAYNPATNYRLPVKADGTFEAAIPLEIPDWDNATTGLDARSSVYEGGSLMPSIGSNVLIKYSNAADPDYDKDDL
ncbi:MAG TPA: hypothetical protein VIL30_08845, partial [Ramlibacter sp.]